jgi:glycerophosphoryl diester phosphodiesterase
MAMVHLFLTVVAACCFFMSGDVMAFDIEAHRGGRALFPENTLQSFANALSMGVDTLELDIGVTRDGAIVVSHERGLNPDLARAADGVYVAPPGIPFVQMRLEDIKKYDVGQIRPGSTYAAQFPEQRAVPGTPIPTLKEVFDLVRRSGDSHVRLNIETKIDPNYPEESPDPQRFVTLLLDLLQAEKFSDRVMVQSFDWRTLQLVQELAPAIPTVYLSLQKGSAATVFLDKTSDWTAGFDPIKHEGSLPRAIKAAGGCDLVAVLRRRRSCADIRIPSSRTFGGGLDGEQARRHRAHDRHGGGRHYIGSSRALAQSCRRQGHRLTHRIARYSLALGAHLSSTLWERPDVRFEAHYGT